MKADTAPDTTDDLTTEVNLYYDEQGRPGCTFEDMIKIIESEPEYPGLPGTDERKLEIACTLKSALEIMSLVDLHIAGMRMGVRDTKACIIAKLQAAIDEYTDAGEDEAEESP
jgi:hypothetical protein